MAKNIVIETDGTAVTYSGVKEIETNDPEEGNVTWIPMDETELAIKTVNQNGTYKAKDDGYYGYRKFIVSTKNKGKTVGTKPDGRTYVVDTDEDGWLTEKLLPDNIRINPQPTKTTYQNGESISLSGAVVKAYSKDDIWEGEGYTGGVIPHEELTLDPATASSSGGGGQQEATSDIPEIQDFLPVLFAGFSRIDVVGAGSEGSSNYKYKSFVVSGATTAWYAIARSGQIGVVFLAASKTPFNFGFLNTPYYEETIGMDQTSNEFTYDEKTVYYAAVSMAAKTPLDSYNAPYNYVSLELSENETKLLAWTMIYGTISGGGSEEITVKWNRPEDEKELTTSFNITVS